MKHVGALILLSLLGACSREQPDTGSAVGTAGTADRTPDSVTADSVTNSSTAPPQDRAPTEVAVQRAQEDATVVAQKTDEEAPDGGAQSPPPPSETPKTMK